MTILQYFLVCLYVYVLCLMFLVCLYVYDYVYLSIHFSMFISFLYMFRATMYPSSGETSVFMRNLVLVILYG